MANEMQNNIPRAEQDFTPQDTQQEIANPQSNEEVYYGSFSSILNQNLGYYVIVEFLVGTNRMEVKEGILYSTGINFITLYDPIHDRYIVCDLYSVKFVTFYNTTTVPPDRLPLLNGLPQNNLNQNNFFQDYLNTSLETSSPQLETKTVTNENYTSSSMPYPPMRGGNRRLF